jgi:hypothetical protein
LDRWIIGGLYTKRYSGFILRGEPFFRAGEARNEAPDKEEQKTRLKYSSYVDIASPTACDCF